MVGKMTYASGLCATLVLQQPISTPAGKSHPSYDAFHASAAGLVEAKMTESYNFLKSIALDEQIGPSFADGFQISEHLDDVARSSQQLTSLCRCLLGQSALSITV